MVLTMGFYTIQSPDDESELCQNSELSLLVNYTWETSQRQRQQWGYSGHTRVLHKLFGWSILTLAQWSFELPLLHWTCWWWSHVWGTNTPQRDMLDMVTLWLACLTPRLYGTNMVVVVANLHFLIITSSVIWDSMSINKTMSHGHGNKK